MITLVPPKTPPALAEIESITGTTSIGVMVDV